jgi:hypothetical protein
MEIVIAVVFFALGAAVGIVIYGVMTNPIGGIIA